MLSQEAAKKIQEILQARGEDLSWHPDSGYDTQDSEYEDKKHKRSCKDRWVDTLVHFCFQTIVVLALVVLIQGFLKQVQGEQELHKLRKALYGLDALILIYILTRKNKVRLHDIMSAYENSCLEDFFLLIGAMACLPTEFGIFVLSNYLDEVLHQRNQTSSSSSHIRGVLG